MAHSTTITTHQATEPGSLGGWAVTCSCGERATFSIELMARQHGADHVAFMARKEGAR